MARSKHSDTKVDDALVALIASTRRIRRKLDLLDVAAKLKVAREGLGSLKKVADAIGLSVEMLRQFSRVEKLSPRVKKLIEQGKIHGVDMADRISRLPSRDQLPVAQAVVRGELNTSDVRAVVSLRKDVPRMRIKAVIDRVKSSRNIKEYVVEFMIPCKKSKKADIEARFAKTVGKNNIRSFTTKKGVGILVLNAAGLKQLQEVAKRRRFTKRRLVNGIASGEVE